MRQILSYHPSFKFFLFPTDIHTTQPPRQSNRIYRGEISEWCITKQHSEINSLASSIIQLFLISCRHSRNSIFNTIRLKIKEHNIWVMHCETTKWDKYSPIINYSPLSCFIQTLTQLNLEGNRIGARGLQHLSDALQNNTVRQILSHHPSFNSFLFHTDTHTTQPRKQSRRR